MKRRKVKDCFVLSTKATFRMFLGVVASFVMMSVASTYAEEEFVDLSSFGIIQYSLPGQLGIADWIVSSDGSSVSPGINNVPSIFIGNTDVSNNIIEFDFVPHSSNGALGFVWGWQSYGDFYSMGWSNFGPSSILSLGKHTGSSHPFNPDDYTGWTGIGPSPIE